MCLFFDTFHKETNSSYVFCTINDLSVVISSLLCHAFSTHSIFLMAGPVQALAQQAKLERAEEIRQELEYCNRVAAERSQRKHKKHFASCRDILEQIVDLATKIGEYRLLTGKYVTQMLLIMP